MEAQLRTISEIAGQKRIFISGSSQAREGFDIEYLNREFNKTNTTFFNLGTGGSASVMILFTIKDRLLKKRPEIIIFMPFVGSFYSNYSSKRHPRVFNLATLPYVSKYLGVKVVKSHKIDFIDSFLGKLSIFYKYRESIKRIIDSYVDYHINGGEKLKPKKYVYKKNMRKSHFMKAIKEAKGNKYSVTPYTRLTEHLFILSARDLISKGVKLIVISGPTHPLIKKCYKGEIDSAYNDFLLNQAKKIGFIYLSESQLPLFTEEEFIDFTHLNSRGRNKMSKFLKDYLQENHDLLEDANGRRDPFRD
ncbi:MAG: hypothetical protein ABH865_06945 [Candidatus Omnitrophota bacterium]